MTYYQEHRDEFLEGLKELLRIPSISTQSEHKPDIRRAAEFLVEELSRIGMDNAGLIEGEGNPLVYAEWRKAPGKPTVIYYGHYDVQPPDPLDEWKSPPFEPEVRNGNIYGRGTADDKGQVYLVVKAVEGLLATRGNLPVNFRFLLEGEEETTGAHITSFLQSKDPRLEADVCLICDTEMFAPGLPTLCVGLRGMVYTEVEITAARQDLHSGVYGGVAPNPLQAIAEIVTTLKDRQGHIRIPGFYDRVVPPTQEEQEAWSSLPFDEKAYREQEMGVPALTGESGYSIFERTWARPTLEVHGIRGGFVGEGAKTVIPARATAKISMRLVADQQPDEAYAQFEKAVQSAKPEGVDVAVRLLGKGPPSLVDTGNPYLQAAAQALEDVFGKPAVYIRSGGSIPIVADFAKIGIPSVLMGFGLPDDNIHAPNEKLNLENFYQGMEAVARYLETLGDQ